MAHNDIDEESQSSGGQLKRYEKVIETKQDEKVVNESDVSTSDDESEDDEAALMTVEQDKAVAEILCALRSKEAFTEEMRAKLTRVDTTLKAKKSERAGRIESTEAAESSDDEVALTSERAEQNLGSESKAVIEDSSDEEMFEAAEEEETKEEPTQDAEVKELFEKYFGDDSALTDDQKFLKSYFLNEQWKTKKVKKNEPPADREGSSEEYIVKELDLEQDHKYLDAADKYEKAYNFRYEEQPHLIGHARDTVSELTEALGKKESKRAQKRRVKKEAEALKLQEEKKAAGLLPLEDAELSKETEDIPKEDDSEEYSDSTEWFACDNCQNAIGANKVKYDCVGGCEDFSLCQKCQKTVKHEHSLRKSKVPSTSEPPKSWRHAVEERFGQEEDPAERLTHHILRTLKYRTDPNFKYTACAPVDLGLTDQELLTLEEGELNTLVPPSALDLYVPEEKLDHLLNKAARRVARLRKVGSKTEASESLTGKADNHVEVKGAKRANKKRKVE